MHANPDPKPAARVVDPAASPLDDRPLRESRCPLCGRQTRELTRHHVVPRGQGGDDFPENLVWACGHGTAGCHGVLTHRNRDGETRLGWPEVALALLDYVDELPEVQEYVDQKKDEDWLLRYYRP